MNSNIPYNDNVFILMNPINVPEGWPNQDLCANWYKVPCISQNGEVKTLPHKHLFYVSEIAVLESNRKIALFHFYPRSVGTIVRETLFADVEKASVAIPVYDTFPLKVLQVVKEQRAQDLGTTLENHIEQWKIGLPYNVASRRTLNAFHFFRNLITKPMPSNAQPGQYINPIADEDSTDCPTC